MSRAVAPVLVSLGVDIAGQQHFQLLSQESGPRFPLFLVAN